MPCVPCQVEKLRNHNAQPTISPSTSATWPNRAGAGRNSASCSCAAVRWHSSGARSYSASSYTSPTTASTSDSRTRRTRGSGIASVQGRGDVEPLELRGAPLVAEHRDGRRVEAEMDPAGGLQAEPPG